MNTPEYGDVIWVNSYGDILDGIFAGVVDVGGTICWKVRLSWQLRWVSPKDCTVLKKGQLANGIKRSLVKKEQHWADNHMFGWCHFVGTTGSPSCKQLALATAE
jgi:hypothetical protein